MNFLSFNCFSSLFLHLFCFLCSLSDFFCRCYFLVFQRSGDGIPFPSCLLKCPRLVMHALPSPHVDPFLPHLPLRKGHSQRIRRTALHRVGRWPFSSLFDGLSPSEIVYFPGPCRFFCERDLFFPLTRSSF